jgi:hypothetical protein
MAVVAATIVLTGPVASHLLFDQRLYSKGFFAACLISSGNRVVLTMLISHLVSCIWAVHPACLSVLQVCPVRWLQPRFKQRPALSD